MIRRLIENLTRHKEKEREKERLRKAFEHLAIVQNDFHSTISLHIKQTSH